MLKARGMLSRPDKKETKGHGENYDISKRRNKKMYRHDLPEVIRWNDSLDKVFIHRRKRRRRRRRSE